MYIRRSDGGRGLISIEDCVRAEELNLKNYAKEVPEELMIATSDIQEETLDEKGDPKLSEMKNLNTELVVKDIEKELELNEKPE